jgi:glycine/D-amino acid oxidase-like deaminating enzyme
MSLQFRMSALIARKLFGSIKVIAFKMELVAGQPYWLIKSGLPHNYPKLSHDTKCDCLVIGGGISGALTAYYLTSAGLECVLVDARAIGLGSTCASTSLLQYELDVPLHQLKKKVGEHRAVRAYQLCGEGVDKLTYLMTNLGFKEFDNRHSLYLSQHAKQKEFMRQEWLARRKAGFEVQLLDGTQLKDAYNIKAEYGILSAKGATNNAYAFTHRLLEECVKKGCKIFAHTKINRVIDQKKRLALRTEQGNTINANHVINATGYEVTRFIDKKIVDLDCTYAMISESNAEQKEPWKNSIMMWNTDNPYLYLCCTTDHRMVIGGRDERFVNVNTMHTYLPRKEAMLEQDFNKLFRSMTFKKEFGWSGVFGKTKDSLPYIGNTPKTPHTFFALGFGGNGITFSLVAAEIITNLLLGKKNDDADIFSFSR